MRIARDVLILAVIFGAIWAFFTYVPVIPDKSYFGVTIEQEKELGERLFHVQIRKNPAITVVDDQTADSLFSVITWRLLEHVEDPLFSYEFVIIKSEDLNAFAMPGGKVVIYSGLIAFAEKPEEIAAVLAHEIGHAQERHVINKLVKEIGLSILFSGDDVVLGQVTQVLGSTKFDRIQEERADDFAFQLMERSAIDPVHFANIMRRLQLKSGDTPDFLSMVSTHPGTRDRIKKAMAYRLGRDFDTTPLDVDMEVFRNSMNTGDKREETE